MTLLVYNRIRQLVRLILYNYTL